MRFDYLNRAIVLDRRQEDEERATPKHDGIVSDVHGESERCHDHGDEQPEILHPRYKYRPKETVRTVFGRCSRSLLT